MHSQQPQGKDIFPWDATGPSETRLLFTVGIAGIQVNPDRYAHAGIKLSMDTWAAIISKIKKSTACMETTDGYLCSDSSGMRYYLIESDEGSPLIFPKLFFNPS